MAATAAESGRYGQGLGWRLTSISSLEGEKSLVEVSLEVSPEVLDVEVHPPHPPSPQEPGCLKWAQGKLGSDYGLCTSSVKANLSWGWLQV